MEILGIGPLEFVFILILALIILGPKDLEKTGRSLAKGLNRFIRSDTWKNLRQASDKVRSLPTELIREAGLEDMKQTVDAEVIQPLKNASAPFGSMTDGIPETQENPATGSLGETNKITPPQPGEEKQQ
jgi:Sec-independent protein translocase protein TatA